MARINQVSGAPIRLVRVSAAGMTEAEYREVEVRLDEALRIFSAGNLVLAADERQILENLVAARKELHELRIEHEVDLLV